MSKIKDQTVGECEVCGADTGIDSPKVCYGCAMAEQGFRVKIEYRLLGGDEAADLRAKPGYRWTVFTGLCEAVRGEALTLAEADAFARDAVAEACRRTPEISDEKVPF